MNLTVICLIPIITKAIDKKGIFDRNAEYVITDILCT